MALQIRDSRLNSLDLDKQAIGFAAVFNLQKDLGMAATEYSWAISLFYFGQFVAEFIFIYVMSRLPVTRTVGISIIIWGGVAACLAAPSNFAGFGAVRFMLGFCEGAVSPAFVIITSTWYKRSEHPIRIAAWISCNGVAQIVGALMMYGIGLAQNVALTNWRIMFLVCGGGTIAAGIAFVVFMPLGPETAWFLTESERLVAVQRLAADRLNKEQSTFKTGQMLEAFKDPKVYIFCLFAFFGTMAGPVLKVGAPLLLNFNVLLTLSAVLFTHHQRIRFLSFQHDACRFARGVFANLLHLVRFHWH
jgi:ACS family allantoate permease-like MFS transporter